MFVERSSFLTTKISGRPTHTKYHTVWNNWPPTRSVIGLPPYLFPLSLCREGFGWVSFLFGFFLGRQEWRPSYASNHLPSACFSPPFVGRGWGWVFFKKQFSSPNPLILIFFSYLCNHYALVAELVDALDLGSSCSRSAGSSPVRRTW